MSAAAATHPTSRMRPVAFDRLERQRGAHCWAALILVALAVYLRATSAPVPYDVVVVGVMVACLFLPAMHGIGAKQPVWDAAMPVDRAGYALVRLACGTVWAAFLLAVAIGLQVVLFGGAGPQVPGESLVERSGWYPLVVFSWGLTCYLLASVVLLRATNEAVDLVYSVPLFVGMCLLLASDVDPAELGRRGVPEALAATALPLGLACAAAYAAARFPARAPEPAGTAARHAHASRGAPPRAPGRSGPAAPRPKAPPRGPARVLPDRPAPRPVRRGGPGHPPPVLTVFRQHFELQRRRAVLAAVVLPVVAAVLLIAELGGRTVPFFVASTALRACCVGVALSWTVLVWLDEHGSQRRWNDALPVGTARRRVVHAAAGAAWLLLFIPVLVAPPLLGAAAVGTLSSPADVPTWLWLELPCRTLSLYLGATFLFFGARLAFQLSPYLAACVTLLAPHERAKAPLFAIVGPFVIFGVPYVFVTQGIGLLASQARIATGDAGPQEWGGAASALWLVSYAAAAAGAIALNDWIYHLDRLPTVREVRSFLVRAAKPGPSHASTRSHP